jgi:L-ascorbate metabolism protein UlaG (beta-lactamase superfamily)
MRRLTILSMLLFFLFPKNDYSQTKNDTCEITYIANEGYLIRINGKKVLTDALFGGIKGNWCDQPDSSVLKKIIYGLPPYDKIDAVLISHRHNDHFSPELVLDFMKNNHNAVLICPDQVSEILLKKAEKQISSRIKTAGASFNDIKISPVKFRHGSWIEKDSVTGKQTDLHEGIENMAFLIESDGFIILHTGDCNTGDIVRFREAGLFDRKIDIVFLDRAFLGREGMEVINNFAGPGNIVLMHIDPAKQEYFRSVVKDFPVFVVFTSKNEKRVFLK